MASTLASTGPWLVSTATMSRAGWPGLIVMGGSKVPGSCGRPFLQRMSPAPLITNTSSAPSPFRSATRGVAWGLVANGPGAANVSVEAQQHRHVVGAAVAGGQVGPAVAVEVPRHTAGVHCEGPHRPGTSSFTAHRHKEGRCRVRHRPGIVPSVPSQHRPRRRYSRLTSLASSWRRPGRSGRRR